MSILSAALPRRRHLLKTTMATLAAALGFGRASSAGASTDDRPDDELLGAVRDVRKTWDELSEANRRHNQFYADARAAETDEEGEEYRRRHLALCDAGAAASKRARDAEEALQGALESRPGEPCGVIVGDTLMIRPTWAPDDREQGEFYAVKLSDIIGLKTR